MALKTTTPTLSIKVTGVDLSQIQTMTITIRQENTTITKTDESIEIDDDVLIVTLSQAESSKFKDGSANISIQATDYSGQDISDGIKVMWAKRGSRTSGSSDGGNSGSVDLSNYYNKQEVDAKLKALREYIDSVILGSGGTEPEPEYPDGEQIYVLKDTVSNTFYSNASIDVKFNVPDDIKDKIKKVIVKSMTLSVAGTGNADSTAFSVYFQMNAIKNDNSTNVTVGSVRTNAGSISKVETKLNDKEIDTEGVTTINYFQLYKSSRTGTGYPYSYNLSFEIELYY